MRNLLVECNKRLSRQGNLRFSYHLQIDTDMAADSDGSNNEKEYEELRKCVTAEHAFTVADRENERMYETVGRYYSKLLSRCPLHQHLSKLGPSAVGPLGFSAFVKVDPARDGLGRAMRLKRMRKPLDNPSVLRGIAYVRQFFLKRLMIRNVACRGEECLVEQTGVLESSRDFLVPSPHQHALLAALMEHVTPKVRLSVIMRRLDEEATPVADHTIPIMGRTSVLGGHAIKVCVSRSQLAKECKVKIKKERLRLEAEVVKYDHSVFGVMKFEENEIVFSHKVKNINKPEYRLGSTRLMCVNLNAKMKKIWRYTDMTRVIARKYNMVKQAVEIQFANRRSVFLVLFSEMHLAEFFSILEPRVLGTDRRQRGVTIIKDSKKEFVVRRFTDEWRKRRMSNYEYLALLNDYASRSFQSLAQYPVFPWLLVNFTEREITLSTAEFRELKYPISGITQRKRDEAEKKYENTDDFPGGRFQFGSHYLPGRAVLGYMMRLQPYTLMIYRFDAGGDCPSRHFHVLENMWNNLKVQCDNNLELIPEFYYNPEFLANQYHRRVW